MKEKAIIILYDDAEDASCPGDPINAGTFTNLVIMRNEIVEKLEAQGIEVVLFPFDKTDYESFRAANNRPDTRQNRAEWAALKSKNQI